MAFHRSLRDSKSPQVFWTLLSILAVLNNVVVLMVSTRPPTSKSSSPFRNPLVTGPKAPITIGIIVTCMFHSFFQFPSKVQVLTLLSTFFQFYSVVNRDSRVDNFASSLIIIIIIISTWLPRSTFWFTQGMSFISNFYNCPWIVFRKLHSRNTYTTIHIHMRKQNQQ